VRGFAWHRIKRSRRLLSAELRLWLGDTLTKSTSSVLYFDLIGGISGDMSVAALLDLGVNFSDLKRELHKLGLKGYSLKANRVERGHAKAIKFDVVIQRPKNYSYSEIRGLVASSRLAPSIKKNIFKIFEVLCEAEIKVHGHSHKNIRFGQLGNTDSIVDIAAVCICLEKLKNPEILYSLIPLNHTVAPATFELIKNKKVYFTENIYENVTPTGMAILCALGKQIETDIKNALAFGACGYGAGFLNPQGSCNALRIAQVKKPIDGLKTDEITVLEANIDDMNPQFFEYLFEKLFDAGALDVFVENVYMKKTRPGFLLSILSNEENLGKIAHLVLHHTTTSGVRFYPVRRLKLARRLEIIRVKNGKARVKVFSLAGDVLKIVPEYEDCKTIARKTKIPILEIYDEAKKNAKMKWRSQA
jgi:uncharacterized protein (TIGR00299 family) protein